MVHHVLLPRAITSRDPRTTVQPQLFANIRGSAADPQESNVWARWRRKQSWPCTQHVLKTSGKRNAPKHKRTSQDSCRRRNTASVRNSHRRFSLEEQKNPPGLHERIAKIILDSALPLEAHLNSVDEKHCEPNAFHIHILATPRLCIEKELEHTVVHDRTSTWKRRPPSSQSCGSHPQTRTPVGTRCFFYVHGAH